jgi:4-oxalocrotonate tautomerase
LRLLKANGENHASCDRKALFRTVGTAKGKLAAEVTKVVMAILKYGEESVSVGIEDVEPNDWAEKVYKPDILARPETIYKKPGYNPL